MPKLLLIIVSVLGFLFFFSHLKAQTFDLTTDSLKIGDVYTVRGSMFEVNKTNLTKIGEDALDSLVDFLSFHKRMILEIGVHSDIINEFSSRLLSEPRALAIAEYLEDAGISRVMLKPKGYGISQPIVAPEAIADMKSKVDREYAKYMNRRIEFTVIGKTEPLSKISFSQVFGTPSIIRIGMDSLVTSSGIEVIYSKSDCIIQGLKSSGESVWKKSLTNLGCKIISFHLVSPEKLKKHNRCDVIFQVEDKTIFGIRSKSGKIKKLKKDKVYPH